VSLFSDLLNDVADVKNATLAKCLFKAKVLASKFPSPIFRRWVDPELAGYVGSESVPDYRSVRPILQGDFFGPFGSGMRNVALSTEGLSPEIRAMLENFRFNHNIGELEAWLNNESEILEVKWPPYMIVAYSQLWLTAKNLQHNGLDAQLRIRV
jgi:hypothetical protein